MHSLSIICYAPCSATYLLMKIFLCRPAKEEEEETEGEHRVSQLIQKKEEKTWTGTVCFEVALLECRFSYTLLLLVTQNVHFPPHRKGQWVPQLPLVSTKMWESVLMRRVFPPLAPCRRICPKRDEPLSRPWVHHRVSPTTSAPVM